MTLGDRSDAARRRARNDGALAGIVLAHARGILPNMTRPRHLPNREFAFRKWLSLMETRYGPIDLAPLEAVRAARALIYPNESQWELVRLLRRADLHVIDVEGTAIVVTPATWAELEDIVQADACPL